MLGLLHTAQAHSATFGELLRELAPEIAVRHAVRGDLLALALADGRVSPHVRSGTHAEVRQLFEAGARVVICTCSTLGDAAESAPHPTGTHVLRVDRPMVEHAVSLGRPILVVAALPTALDTALALLRRVAPPATLVRSLLCDAAWPRFQVGDHAGYAAAICEAVRDRALPNDAVVLAQASMMPAARLLEGSDFEVFVSPKLAVQKALTLLG